MEGAVRIVVGPGSAELRRSLRPIEWMVLEDVALDARPDGDGALVASTSARRVAEHLGVTPGAAAGALARLRSTGLVTHARQAGPAGRFGLSAYVLGPVPGVEVLDAKDRTPPDVGPPDVAPPPTAPPCVVEPHMVAADGAEQTASSGARPRARRSDQAAATSAPASAGSDPAAARAADSRTSAPDTHRRATGRSAVVQLSMLDSLTDPQSDTTPHQQP